MAIEAMKTRCTEASFALWSRAFIAKSTLSSDERLRVEPFIRTAFGLPRRELPPDHLQGYVAELAWFLVLRDLERDDRRLELITPPSFHVTGPGADGLVIYEIAGRLVFRLWEIKKHNGSAHVSRTIAKAYEQLDEKATEYLAQLTALAGNHDGDLADLLAGLVELWVSADARAGLGIAVSTSNRTHPKRSFSTMGDRFPQFATAGQLEGLVLGLADLPSFAGQVRDVVWSVL